MRAPIAPVRAREAAGAAPVTRWQVPELGAPGGAHTKGKHSGLGPRGSPRAALSPVEISTPRVSLAHETLPEKRGSHPCQSRVTQAGAAAVRGRCGNARGRMKHTSGSARGQQGIHKLGFVVKPSRYSGDGSRAQAAPGKRMPSAAQRRLTQSSKRVPGAAGSELGNK